MYLASLMDKFSANPNYCKRIYYIVFVPRIVVSTIADNSIGLY